MRSLLVHQKQWFLASFFSILFSFTVLISAEKTVVNFLTEDSVQITADLYDIHPSSVPFIILFHQAGWSRGEYLEIAPKLNQLGFNCLAVDQRSGGEINNVVNLTHLQAKKMGKPTEYLDALADLIASIKWVKRKYPDSKTIIWGSSYSAALVLKIAGDQPELINGVLAFSPGEYFERFGQPDDFIRSSAKNINCPVFITASKSEAVKWKPIYNILKTQEKKSFIPETDGNHGSRALWEKFSDHQVYWDAVKSFLARYYKN